MKDWKTVLAVTDFSDSATNAAWRAGRVACQHGARLSLLHVIAATEPAADPAVAERRLRVLASRLRDALGLSVDCRVVRGDPQQEIADAARSAGVLVLGSRRRNTLREFLMGTAAERLIRLARIPVLVVKREAGPDYRRVLVPVELAPHAEVAIATALDFSPGATVEVFHALSMRHEVSLRAADVSEAVLRSYRQRTADKARDAIRSLIQSAGGSGRATPALGFGHAASIALHKEAAMAAELVVIGKRHRSVVAEFFLGGVTQRMLAGSRADVLVLAGGPDPTAQPRLGAPARALP